MNLLHQALILITSFVLSVLPANKYTEGVVGQPRSFFPSQNQTQNDKTISTLIYRGLFKYDIYGNLAPDLAETWDISEDGLVYTIKIKDSQKWTDGTKITSDDLIYTAFKISDLQGVATDRVDELTVRYTLPNKFSPFLSLLTVGVMQNNSEENQNPLQPVSSGKFKIIKVEKSGPIIKEVTLWNSNTEENIRKLVFRYYVNESELMSGARLGEIDGFSAHDEPKLQSFTEFKFPLQGVYFALYFNLRKESVQDLELRQKLEKVLNLPSMIANSGITVEGPVSRSVFTDREIDFDKYERGFVDDLSGKTLSITVPDIDEHVDLAGEIAQVWKDKLGINVEVRTVNPAEFVDTVIKTRDYEILFYGQEVGRDPDRYVNWHSTQKDYPGLNLSGFDHVRADRALEEGRKIVDNDTRVIHYNEFQKVIVDQVPVIFLYHPYTRYFVSNYVEGIGEKYTFTLSDRFLDFSNWKRVKTL